MKKSLRPKARPDNLSVDRTSLMSNKSDNVSPSMGTSSPSASAGSGGKGGGEPLSASKTNDEKIAASLSPDSGWGYYDPNTRERVPWFIDMINGGGRNAAGDKFSGGFGIAGLLGGLLNAVGVNPYGSQREREYMPMESYRGGELFSAAPASTPAGGGGAAVSDILTYGPQNGRGGQRVSREDRLMGVPVQAMSAEDRLMGLPVQANPLYAQAAAEAEMGLDPFGYPKSPETMQQAPLQSGFNQIGSSASNLPSQSLIDAAVSRGTSGGVPNNYAEGIFGAGVETRSPTIQQNERLTKFNQLTSTIPQPLMGTQAAQIYADAVINGQTMLSFKEFFGQNFR